MSTSYTYNAESNDRRTTWENKNERKLARPMDGSLKKIPTPNPVVPYTGPIYSTESVTSQSITSKVGPYDNVVVLLAYSRRYFARLKIIGKLVSTDIIWGLELVRQNEERREDRISRPWRKTGGRGGRGGAINAHSACIMDKKPARKGQPRWEG